MSQVGGPGGLAVLRHRRFALLWTAQLVSTVGTGLTTIAAALLVYRVTGSAGQVGLLMVAGAAPGLLVGLLAGVVGDRGDRATTMIRCDLVCAVAVGAIPVLVPFGLGWLPVLVATSATSAQFFAPAQASLLPETVPDRELAAANGLMTVSQFGALALGYAAAGALTGSLEVAFALDAVSFLVSAGCIRAAGLPTDPGLPAAATAPGQVGPRPAPSVLADLREGFRTVRNTPVLWSLALVFGPIFAAYALANALALTFALRALGASELEYSGLEIAFSAGFVLSSLALAGVADRVHPGQWVTLGVAGTAVANLVLATAVSVPAALVLSLLVGIANAPPYVGRQLLVQRWAPKAGRARVNSLFFVLRDAAGLLGMASAGLADLVDVRALMAVDAVVLLGCAVATAILPGLRGTRHEWHRLRVLLQAPAEPVPGSSCPVATADVADLDRLLPAFARLGEPLRREVIAAATVVRVPAGATVLQLGDPGTAAFVLLEGRAVATLPGRGVPRVLEVHGPGDVFGEIAALTGSPRTATVLAQDPCRVVRVPAAPLRSLLVDPDLRALLLSGVRARLGRTALCDLPRFPTSSYAVLEGLSPPSAAPQVQGSGAPAGPPARSADRPPG